MRRDHPALETAPITLAELSQYEFVSPSDSRPFGAIIRNLFESHGIEWRTQVHVIDYFPIVRRIVASSNAVGVVALTSVASSWFQRDFAVLDHQVLFEPFRMCCALRARWEMKPAVRAFINAVQTGPSAQSELRRP